MNLAVIIKNYHGYEIITIFINVCQGVDGAQGEVGPPGEKGAAAIIPASWTYSQKGETGPRGDPGR